MSRNKKLILYGAILLVGLLVFILEIFVFQKPDGILGLIICIASVLMVLGSIIKLCILSPKFEESFLTALDIFFTAVFGGVKCDLRNAIIEKDCAIQVSAIFGGIDIFVPAGINVRVNSNSIFGGVSNKTAAHQNAPTLYISGRIYQIAE